MPKEVKAKGERKKRAKKGKQPPTSPTVPPSDSIIPRICGIDWHLSRSQRTQAWSFCLHVLCSSTLSRLADWPMGPQSGWLTSWSRKTVMRSGMRTPTSASVSTLSIISSRPLLPILPIMMLTCQAKSARSSVNAGRTCPRRKKPCTKPRQVRTRNVTKPRREHTT